jgi:hypothetical protein
MPALVDEFGEKEITRMGEQFSLTGDDVDLNGGLIRLRLTKNGQSRFVPSTVVLWLFSAYCGIVVLKRASVFQS